MPIISDDRLVTESIADETTHESPEVTFSETSAAILRVRLQLRDALLALRVKLHLLRTLLEVLELDDVAIRHVAVVVTLRKEEEVAVVVLPCL